jgi:cytochrome c biogenesis protein CcmG/thiol:disulfide interchange protein DsbE
MRRALGPAAVALAAVAAFVVLELASGTSNSPGSRRAAPALPPAALIGRPVSISDLRGKPAVVNFWASWCKPCREEAPQLRRLSRTLHGSARIVGVDYTDDAGSGRDFARRYGWDFPLLRDPNGTYGDRYQLNGLPATAVLDAKGRIASLLKGPQTVATLRSALAEARS